MVVLKNNNVLGVNQPYVLYYNGKKWHMPQYVLYAYIYIHTYAY